MLTYEIMVERRDTVLADSLGSYSGGEGGGTAGLVRGVEGGGSSAACYGKKLAHTRGLELRSACLSELNQIFYRPTGAKWEHNHGNK